MPRAFCPECGSEVPVDDDGVCHVGHRVDTVATGSGPAADAEESDEPQPWVASVDSTTLGGFTPPPGDEPVAEPEGEPWIPPADPADAAPGGDDLAAAAAAAVDSVETTPDGGTAVPGPDPVEGQDDQVEAGWPRTLPSEGEVPGWTPPTNDPAAPAPVPPPAPAEPPAPAADDDADDFDLDDLAAAVSELGMDDAAPSPTSPAAAAPTEPVAPVDGAAPSDDHAAWEDDLGDPAAEGTADDAATSTGPATDAAPVDLSNFTAKGGKVGPDAGKGGRFRKR
ncbi:MAG: hypothetical protein KY461_04135 [Actinobacteria bacterium]|nr:hypothetical protein [Actinomycetota bacterium]